MHKFLSCTVAVVFGCDVDEYVREYVAHGAQRVYVTDHPALRSYNVETYVFLMITLARKYAPETVLVGATAFGRELQAAWNRPDRRLHRA